MNLFVMTEEVQTGKTTWIRRMLHAAGALPACDAPAFGVDEQAPMLRKLSVAGVYTPAVFETAAENSPYGTEAGVPVKTAISAVLMPQGERFTFATRRTLAELDAMEAAGQMRRMWAFDDGATETINQHFTSPTCADSDLLLVDELGWLEFEKGLGYTQAMKLLDDGVPRNALIVVRRDLLHFAHERWSDLREVTPQTDIAEFLNALD